MLNERDGGIGGVKLIVEECETGYDTKKGVECYEQVKGKKPVVINPYSTGITLQLIPKAAVDKIPILSMAYGLSASADGNNFPWVFNPPATYWDGLSMIIRYIGGKEGGLDKLKGKTIGFIFSTAATAASRSRCSSSSPRTTASTVKLYPVPASRNAEPVGAVAQRPPRPSGLDDHVGLGRDEPDRGARKPPRSTIPMDSSSASGGRAARTTRVRRRPGAKGYLVAQLQRRRRQLSRRSRTSRNTSSTRARARPRRTRSARISTTAASTIRC